MVSRLQVVRSRSGLTTKPHAVPPNAEAQYGHDDGQAPSLRPANGWPAVRLGNIGRVDQTWEPARTWTTLGDEGSCASEGIHVLEAVWESEARNTKSTLWVVMMET